MKQLSFKRSGLFLLALTLSTNLFFTVPTAQACSCVMPGTPTEEMEKSDAVFAGEVKSIDSADIFNQEVVLSVQEAWKGIDDSTVTVFTGESGAGCGFNFVEGDSYLVYAYKSEGKFYATSCGATALLANSTEALQELGAGTPFEQTDANEDGSVEVNENLLKGGALLLILVLGSLAIVYRPKKK